MHTQDGRLGTALRSAALPAEVSAARRRDVHQRMSEIMRTTGLRRRRWPAVAAAGVVVTAGAAWGVAGTESGRAFVHWLFTRLEPMHTVSEPVGGDSMWVHGRGGPGAEPFTDDEATVIRKEMDEMAALKATGAGRLTAIMEGPAVDGVPGWERMHTVYTIEYTLADGTRREVGDSAPSPAQRAKMQLDEIVCLWDAGACELVCRTDFPLGTGRYTVRFSLTDGQTVDVHTNFAPGPRAEREAIFAEIRELKDAGRFVVLSAWRAPDGVVHGALRYTLADGRTVGVTDTVPEELVTPDGECIMTPAEDLPQDAEAAGA